jgi:hypothetical protein
LHIESIIERPRSGMAVEIRRMYTGRTELMAAVLCFGAIEAQTSRVEISFLLREIGNGAD